MTRLDDLLTPSLLVFEDRLEANLHAMQCACHDAGIELRPHIKTHKMVPIARRQLELGAKGLTCAKIGEAETMLASGVRQIFIAHSLVDLRQAPRLIALADQLNELRLAVTSETHVEPLLALIRKTGRQFPLMLALDTGLNREGARNLKSAQRIATRLAREPLVQLAGFYTHEGQFYGGARENRATEIDTLLDQLCTIRDTIDPSLPLWPGCSVSAQAIAASASGRVQALRPGAYVFGDISLSLTTGIMPVDQVALHVLATVVDKPTPDLALIDAGSKTFSSDRTSAGLNAVAADGRDLAVVAVNEEHGYVRGTDLNTLQIGDRVQFIPAHVCTVVNLANEVQVLATDNSIKVTWPVDARGKNQ